MDNFKISQEQLQVLQGLLEPKLDEILDAFDVSLHRNRKRYWGKCCIHGGDNQAALNINHNLHDESRPFWWVCYTHHCEGIFRKSLLGLIRGLLSRNKLGWEKLEDKQISFLDTLQWCEKFLGVKVRELTVNQVDVGKQKFINLWLNNYQKRKAKLGISREEVRQRLIIPSEYFIKRGFSEAILDHYDVGMSKNNNTEMYGRAIAPIYEDTAKYLIGCTGRTIFDQCKLCHSFHNSKAKCPKEEIRHLYSKWKHNNNFDKRNVLYNYWYAAKNIQKTGKAILAESPGSIWKLVEANINVGLGMFGSELHEEQQILLEKCGAMTIYIWTDNDEAGRNGRIKIEQQLKRTFNIKHLESPASFNDLGETPTDVVRKICLGTI